MASFTHHWPVSWCSLPQKLCQLSLTSISKPKQKPWKTKRLHKSLKASLSVLASLWRGNSSLTGRDWGPPWEAWSQSVHHPPPKSGIGIPDYWVPEHSQSRLMRSMLINKNTLPPYTPRLLKAITTVPQRFHLQTAHKMNLWDHLLLDTLKLLEVCNYLGLFLRKHVHQSSQRVFFTKVCQSSLCFPHPLCTSQQKHYNKKSGYRKLQQGADDGPKTTEWGIPTPAWRGRILLVTIPKRA